VHITNLQALSVVK
jgi:hypothetical protein